MDRYQKPIYDPFEVFNPPASLIKSLIKEFKNEAYKILNEINYFKNHPDTWLFEGVIERLERDHKRLCYKVSDFSRRLDSFAGGSTYGSPGRRAGEIGPEEINRARERPIYDLFPTDLRKVGGKWSGKCPFHSSGQEKTPSFVLYPNNTYYCFACNEAGDSIAFIMKLNNLQFIEAVKALI